MLTGRRDVDRRFFTRLIDDHLVVIDVDRMELRVLNPTAAALWLLLGKGEPAQSRLIDEIAGLFGADRAVVAADVGACLAEWDALGWVQRAGGDDARLSLTGATVPAIRREGVSPAAAGERPPIAPVAASRVGMIGADLLLRLGRTADSPYADLLRRLEAMLSGFPPAAADPAADEACFTFIVADDRIWIETPSGVVWSADPSGALSHLMLHLLLAGDPHARLLATVHAAAMGRPGGLLVMPGLSGNGKSTLTAYLAAHGWRYAGDDIVALTESKGGPLVVTPFPTAVSLKPGSWPVLGALYPEIAALPTTPYAGKTARFLPLPPGRHVGPLVDDRGPRAIVFPRFDPGSQGELEPLSTLETLLELMAAGFTTGDRLEEDRLNRLFDMLEQTPKYRLSYPSLELAERCLSGLLS